MTEELTQWEVDFLIYVGEILEIFKDSGYLFEASWPIVYAQSKARGKDHVLARDTLQVIEGHYLRGPGRRLKIEKGEEAF